MPNAARIATLNFAYFIPAKQLREAFNVTAQHNVLQGRVCPKCADFVGAALGTELPTKTVDFINTVNLLMAQVAPKLEPQKKLCEALRFTHEWATLLRECSKSKTLPDVDPLPEWSSESAVAARTEAKAAKAAATKAAKKAKEIAEAAEAAVEAAVEAAEAAAEAAAAEAEANAEAEALASASLAETVTAGALSVTAEKLENAVECVYQYAYLLTAEQRQVLALALASAEESAEAAEA